MIPNEEQYEAAQEDANKRRAELVAEMNGGEKAKMKAIEDAANILEQAGVKFHMYAQPYDGERPSLFLFHKHSYAQSFDQRVKEGSRWFNAVIHQVLICAAQSFCTYMFYHKGVPVGIYSNNAFIPIANGETGINDANKPNE